MGIFSKIYKIHPTIGIARVGNAPAEEYFIGPTIPEANADYDPKGYAAQYDRSYKNKNNEIKPQGALFTVWEYWEHTQRPIREINSKTKNIDYISWFVHVANKKAGFFRFSGPNGESGTEHDVLRNEGEPEAWHIDPGPRFISGNELGFENKFQFIPGFSDEPEKEKWIKNKKGKILDPQYLGEIITDPKGRLIFIGGKGLATSPGSKKIDDPYNNKNWFDDISDGIVRAFVKFKKKKSSFSASPSWVIVGPPDYAPQILPVVSGYDLLANLSAHQQIIKKVNKKMIDNYPSLGAIKKNSSDKKELNKYKPHFHDDILPLLKRSFHLAFVNKQASVVHKSFNINDPKTIQLLNDSSEKAKPLRNGIFKRMRMPGTRGDSISSMPMMHGDQYGSKAIRAYLTITPMQYQLLKKWSEGDFEVTEKPSRVDSPMSLDIANLEKIIGGAFHPGIEVGWQIREPSIWSADPFRLNTEANDPIFSLDPISPGHFSRQLAVPWQADFSSCMETEMTDAITKKKRRYAFWPSQRPDEVPNAKKGMVPWLRTKAGTDNNSLENMLNNWSRLGFVIKNKDGSFVEQERQSMK